MTAPVVDLGYGTTQVPYAGTCAVWYDNEGRRVTLPMRWLYSLALAAQLGQAEAGHRLGVTAAAIHQLHIRLYKRLGVNGRWEAMHALRWTAVPDAFRVDPREPSRLPVPVGSERSAEAAPAERWVTSHD